MRFDTGDSHDTAKFYVSVLENEVPSKRWRDLEHERGRWPRHQLLVPA